MINARCNGDKPRNFCQFIQLKSDQISRKLVFHFDLGCRTFHAMFGIDPGILVLTDDVNREPSGTHELQ